MLILDLAGTHYEMGRQHARTLFRYRPALLGLIAQCRQMISQYPTSAIKNFLDESAGTLQQYSPQTRDMLYGLADGFEVPRNDILSLRLRSYFEDRLATRPGSDNRDEECTIWAFSMEKNGKGATVLAKNRDFLSSNRSLTAVFRCKPDNGYEYFSINSIGSCNVASSGINREGLAIADTRVLSSDIGPGLPRFSLMMHMLENYKSVDDAIAFLKSVPRMGGGNLVFADSDGKIVKAEIGFKNMGLVKRDAGWVACTNHFEETVMQKSYRIISNDKKRDSKQRYEKVSESLAMAGDGVDFKFAKALQSYHGENFAICNHGRMNGPHKVETLSSTIFEIERSGFYHCEGTPCQGHFQWISF